CAGARCVHLGSPIPPPNHLRGPPPGPRAVVGRACAPVCRQARWHARFRQPQLSLSGRSDDDATAPRHGAPLLLHCPLDYLPPVSTCETINLFSQVLIVGGQPWRRIAPPPIEAMPQSRSC